MIWSSAERRSNNFPKLDCYYVGWSGHRSDQLVTQDLGLVYDATVTRAWLRSQLLIAGERYGTEERSDMGGEAFWLFQNFYHFL